MKQNAFFPVLALTGVLAMAALTGCESAAASSAAASSTAVSSAAEVSSAPEVTVESITYGKITSWTDGTVTMELYGTDGQEVPTVDGSPDFSEFDPDGMTAAGSTVEVTAADSPLYRVLADGVVGSADASEIQAGDRVAVVEKSDGTQTWIRLQIGSRTTAGVVSAVSSDGTLTLTMLETDDGTAFAVSDWTKVDWDAFRETGAAEYYTIPENAAVQRLDSGAFLDCGLDEIQAGDRVLIYAEAHDVWVGVYGEA